MQEQNYSFASALENLGDYGDVSSPPSVQKEMREKRLSTTHPNSEAKNKTKSRRMILGINMKMGKENTKNMANEKKKVERE